VKYKKNRTARDFNCNVSYNLVDLLLNERECGLNNLSDGDYIMYKRYVVRITNHV